ncbi:hypothetical protein OG216_24535 [Streptomycetaceae bacterium NBC_01309]
MRKSIRQFAVAVIAPAVLLLSSCSSDSGGSDAAGSKPGSTSDATANGGPAEDGAAKDGQATDGAANSPSSTAPKDLAVLSGAQLAAALVTTEDLPGRTATPDDVSRGSEMGEGDPPEDRGTCQPLFDLLGGTDWYVAKDENLPDLFTATKVRESGRPDNEFSGYEFGLSQHPGTQADNLLQGARDALANCGLKDGYEEGAKLGFGDDSLTVVVPTDGGTVTFSYVRSGTVLVHAAPVTSYTEEDTANIPAAPESLLRTQYDKLLRTQTT